MKNEALVAVPLFILWASSKNRTGRDLLEAMGHAFGELQGGLGISVLLVGAILAASTGNGATVVTMGLMSLPVMSIGLRSDLRPG